jgi:5-methyltetrahydrofolate--homocysteine methyltransferase
MKGRNTLTINFSNKIFCFDGAMGTMLQSSGLTGGELPENYNLDYPQIITDIHKSYIEAGADIITTNTFGANELKLKNNRYSLEEVISHAVQNAQNAVNGTSCLIAFDIGPLGKLMAPMGDLSFEDAYGYFQKQIQYAVSAGVDLLLFETFSDLYELKAGILAAKENCDLPIFCTMTFDQNKRTLTGTDPLTLATVLEGLGVSALGLNCSLGPEELKPMVSELLTYTDLPIMIQPNAGLPKMKDAKTFYDVMPEEFAAAILDMVKEGVTIVGGCCGTNPSFIQAIKSKLPSLKPSKRTIQKTTRISSGNKTVVIDEVRVIGERINPTGKKKLQAALKSEDLDYILREAIEQKKAKADILDINVGMPGIDEGEMIQKVIKEVQSIMNLPLQIDSANAETIEKAVRIYNGKPLINSVNGKKTVLRQILPIVKKYGAAVIGLTLDENGIPATAEERVKIAEDIIYTAEHDYGIPRENILIDCLVLTASAQQKEVMETIKALRMVKEKFGVKTLLGVSNVSYGLPERLLLNKTYLAMALAMGLDIPILNPMAEDMMDTIKAFKVLANQDKEAKAYIKAFNALQDTSLKEEKIKPGTNNPQDIASLVASGLKEQVEVITKDLLITHEPLWIMENHLIPALDQVGLQYEKGEIFLPELMQAADTVKSAFDLIKQAFTHEGDGLEDQGAIILATVKDDIHDIGKNIVRTLLENYGFKIIDLGKDVSFETILETVTTQKVTLIGLSALMTTTVINMEDIIKRLKAAGITSPIMVGGAVLTEDYALKIGADYYCKDARQSVEVARKVFQIS